MSKAALEAKNREEKRESLRAKLPPGSKIYTLEVHTSRSAALRRFRAFMVVDGEIEDITWEVAQALGWKMKEGAVVLDGGGMDMSFALVHAVSLALHGHESKGRGAESAAKGVPLWNPDAANYRAGFTLERVAL